jgi:hypothetical protein
LSTDVKISKTVWKLKEKVSAATMSNSPIAAAIVWAATTSKNHGMRATAGVDFSKITA